MESAAMASMTDVLLVKTVWVFLSYLSVLLIISLVSYAMLALDKRREGDVFCRTRDAAKHALRGKC